MGTRGFARPGATIRKADEQAALHTRAQLQRSQQRDPRHPRPDSKYQNGPGLGCRIAIASSAVMSCITASMPARID